MDLRRETALPRDSLAGAIFDGIHPCPRQSIGIQIGLTTRILDQQHRPVPAVEPPGELLERVLLQAHVAEDVEMDLRLPEGQDLLDRVGADNVRLHGDRTGFSRQRAGQRRAEGQGEDESSESRPEEPAPGEVETPATAARQDLVHRFSGSPPSEGLVRFR
jgi:hypothetical protein